MKTQPATTEEGVTPPADQLEGQDGPSSQDDGRIMVGQDGYAEAVDSEEEEAALLTGFARVNAGDEAQGGKPAAKDPASDEEEIDVDTILKKREGEGGDDDPGEGEPPAATQQPPANDDPDIPGLGKVSEVKARLAKVDALEKAVASTSGHLGHLKQLVTQAQKGREITAEHLKSVSDEFGPEFAQAMAKDLSQLSLGGPGGQAVDMAEIESRMEARLEARAVEMHRASEKRAVLRRHPDADDHFSRVRLDDKGAPVFETKKDDKGNDVQVPVWDAGPKFNAFLAFTKTLPDTRQRELEENGWDADVMNRALDDFKAYEKKAANKQAIQQQRTSRSVLPTQGKGGTVVAPSEDPMEAGWKNVRGARSQQQGARR